MSESKISLIKQGFFNTSIQVKRKDFSFIEDDFDLNFLQFEFSSLYQLFIVNKETWLNNIEIISYTYYLCNLMILYYQYDYVRADLERLKEKRQAIETFVKENCSLEEQEFINACSYEVKTHILNNVPSLISISKIRKYISILNSNRSHWGYSRTLATHIISYLQRSCTGDQCVSLDIINLLDKSRKPMSVLGVILYELRFFINLGIMTKHIVQAAMNKELAVKNVLKQEMEKRGFTMLSDLVWGIVILLTTYNNFFRIPLSTLSPMITSFLTFDALVLIAKWSINTAKYNKQLVQLKEQEREATEFERYIINRQIDLLNDEWEAQNAYYFINILAANIIAISFGLSMICSGPIVLAGLAFFSMLGNALYNTSEEYKKYQQSRIALRREISNGIILNDEHHRQLIEKLNKKCSQSCADFWQTLIYNTGGSAFIITVAAVSWPAALTIALCYMVYRLYNTYQKPDEYQDQEASQSIYRLFHDEQLKYPGNYSAMLPDQKERYHNEFDGLITSNTSTIK